MTPTSTSEFNVQATGILKKWYSEMMIGASGGPLERTGVLVRLAARSRPKREGVARANQSLVRHFGPGKSCRALDGRARLAHLHCESPRPLGERRQTDHARNAESRIVCDPAGDHRRAQHRPQARDRRYHPQPPAALRILNTFPGFDADAAFTRSSWRR